MDYKKKKYYSLDLIALLVSLLLSSSVLFVQKVNADYEFLRPSEVYDAAWNTLNEKFYFKSEVNLKKWEARFKNKIHSINDAHRYINKLVKDLNDPYTLFLTKEQFKDEQDFLKSTLVGIGVKLAAKKPVIINVLPDSPAYYEGLKSNDYIIKVNNTSTKYLKPSQVVNLMRGPLDSPLIIKVKRKNETITKTLYRKELNFNPVSTQTLENGLAVVKIDSFFPENTSRLFRDEILKLMSKEGIIIDLRNNTGGLLQNAIETADMFLSEGRIVSTINGTGKSNEYANSSKIYDAPVIILVNENTASASEIFTSALMENKRAIVIGKKTYGKGLVQQIIKLPDDSALHVTTAAYLTPNGKSIHKTGIVPHKIIIDEEMQIQKAKEILVNLKNNTDKSKIASL